MFSLKNVRKAAATVAATALLAGVFGIAAPASADTTGPIAEPNGNINLDATGSITVHKHEHSAGAATPVQPDNTATPAGDAISGIPFSVYAVPGFGAEELGENPSLWNTIKTLDAATYATGTPFKAEVLTDENGEIVFGDLPVGAYVVVEGDAGADKNIIAKADPFLVTIPFPFGEGADAEWLYDVHVYPKNATANISKAIVDPTAPQIGEAIGFPVTVKLPTLGESAFTAAKLDDAQGNANFSGFAVVSVVAGTETLTAADYNYAAGVVTFTDSGLEQLTAAQGENLVVTFTGGAKTVGITENVAKFVFSSGSNDVNPRAVSSEPITLTSNVVSVGYGDFVAVKVDAADETAKLEGAVFDVYQGVRDGDVCVTDEFGAAETVGDAIYTDIVSDSEGMIVVPGLFVATSNTTIDFNCYALVETAAPLGFDLITDPISVVVTPGSENGGEDFKIYNPKSDVLGDIELPLTGAAGQLLMTLAGLAIVTFALGMVIVRRKKLAEEAR